jgi:dCTP deaminase
MERRHRGALDECVRSSNGVPLNHLVDFARRCNHAAMVISKPTFESLLFCKDLTVTPMHDSALQPASIDLCLHGTVGRYSTLGVLDTRSESPGVDLFDIPPHGLCLQPGSNILARTVEEIRIPTNMCGLLVTRSSMSRVMLMVQCLSGFIDPGFEGSLDLQIFNAGSNPVRIYAGDRLAQLVVFQLTTPAPAYSGKYQHKASVTGFKPDSP